MTRDNISSKWTVLCYEHYTRENRNWKTRDFEYRSQLNNKEFIERESKNLIFKLKIVQNTNFNMKKGNRCKFT